MYDLITSMKEEVIYLGFLIYYYQILMILLDFWL